MSPAAAPSSVTGVRPAARSAAPYRIMVVDDSAVIRGLLTRSLEADPDLVLPIDELGPFISRIAERAAP